MIEKQVENLINEMVRDFTSVAQPRTKSEVRRRIKDLVEFAVYLEQERISKEIWLSFHNPSS